MLDCDTCKFLLRRTVDALPDPIFILTPDKDCLFGNVAFFKFLNISPGEGDGSVPISHFWPDIDGVDLRLGEFACELRTVGGEAYTVKLNVTPMAGGFHLARILAGISRKDSVQNFHSQRLETLGMLAGGVAHDFNNVLAGILGHVSYLKTVLAKSGQHSESLLAIEEGANKATGIIQQILNFSKLSTTEKLVRVNLCDLVTRTCTLLRGAISPELRLEFAVPKKEIPVLSVEGKLAQVVVNLAVNARDAVKPGGYIRVSLDDNPEIEDLKDAFRTDDLPCERYATITVEDNGCGMPPEVLSRIFEPYFSTKKEKGTGLGLSTVASIVKGFGGVLEVVSEVDIGTRVTVYLPMFTEKKVPKAAPGRLDETQERKLETGSERVLVVDDEAPVRNVLSLSLQHLGYAVDCAASGHEAIERYFEEKNKYSLVIMDMLMPVMSGERLFFKLKEFDQGVKVLVISGFASEEAVNNILSNGGLDFIQKPFTIEELARRVRACLDGKVSVTPHA